MKYAWKLNNLYDGTELVMSVVPDKTYPQLWRVKYPDGVLSDDLYNQARAKEHAVSEIERIEATDYERLRLEQDLEDDKKRVKSSVKRSTEVRDPVSKPL